MLSTTLVILLYQGATVELILLFLLKCPVSMIFSLQLFHFDFEMIGDLMKLVQVLPFLEVHRNLEE